MHPHSTHLDTFQGRRAHRQPASPARPATPAQDACGFFVACGLIAVLLFLPW